MTEVSDRQTRFLSLRGLAMAARHVPKARGLALGYLLSPATRACTGRAPGSQGSRTRPGLRAVARSAGFHWPGAAFPGLADSSWLHVVARSAGFHLLRWSFELLTQFRYRIVRTPATAVSGRNLLSVDRSPALRSFPGTPPSRSDRAPVCAPAQSCSQPSVPRPVQSPSC